MYSIQNRRYLGNKFKLLSFIKETINNECGDFDSLFDVFSGTGAVASDYLDKKIITNDILYSNYISHIAWFKKAKYGKRKLERIIAEYNSIAEIEEENYMSLNFSDTFFSHFVCKKIGYIREDIELKYNAGAITEKERAILITSLLYSMDKIANTCGHYDAYRKGAELPNDITLQMLDIPSDVSSKNEFYNCDSNELALKVKCDIAYLDPPYNSRQYGDAYHLLENVAKWEKPSVKGVARKMNRDHLKSDYCLSSATQSFEELIERLQCKYIILSYNNTGDSANGRSNAKISDEDIIRILEKKGEVKIFSQKYRAFTTGKSQNDYNAERLFVCKVQEKTKKDMSKKIISSPMNYTGGKAKLLPQILPLFPSNIDTFIDLFCGGCNVGLNVSANTHIYNDINSSVVDLYRFLQSVDKDIFLDKIDKLIEKYNLTNSAKNGYSIYGCESASGLGEYNKVGFMKLREDFNSYEKKDITFFSMFYTLITFAFNNQIRFNSKGEFNLPVGKRDFNKKMRNKLITFIETIQKQNAIFECKDFSEIDIPENCFVYMDPPYLISTATYNENGGWSEDEEKKLLSFMSDLIKKGIPFALSNVIRHKGNENTLLIEWCNKNKDTVRVIHLNYNYNNSNYQSTGKQSITEEVLVVNY